MTDPTILAYSGENSQTGFAVKQEFPTVVIVGNNESFEEIAAQLQTKSILSALPMWNSHKGEIKQSKVIELLFEKKSRLFHMWPAPILFECLKKPDRQMTNIISVHVAEEQCSNFIRDHNVKFIEADNTPVAYKRFKSDDGIDAVLRRPQENNDGFEVVSKHAENPINFTSFVLLGGVGVQYWSKSNWGSLYRDIIKNAQNLYLGIQMPIQPAVLSDDQLEVLEDLMGEAKTIQDVPRILFVSERTPGVCGLLIEADPGLEISDILSDDGLSSDIIIIPDMGQTSSQYPSRISQVMDKLSPGYRQHDFVRHRGRSTCFYACPPLDLITHGYEEDVVEPVVREIISKYFEMYIKGTLRCTEMQQAFFDKHKPRYIAAGKYFIEFTDIGQ